MNTHLVIADHSISVSADGMYNLNDLHRAAIAQGKANSSHKPSEFKRFNGAFITALETKAGFPALKTVRGGKRPGTWAVELVAMKYAGWIDAGFEVDVYSAAQTLRRIEHEEFEQNHRRELADCDIPFPPSDRDLLKCETQQLASALCLKAFATRFMLSIDPHSGKFDGHRGGDSITLWPVADRAHVIDPHDPQQLQRMIDFMGTDELADLMKMTLAAITRRTAALMQPH